MFQTGENLKRLAMAVAFFAAFAATPSFSKDAPDGKGLYAGYCASCHGAIDKSDVRGATLEEIKYAMTDRMCGEAGGKKLTDAQLGTIARALSGKAR